jgi:ankyrin repeat protein
MFRGTYYEPSTGRLGLQLKAEDKDYTVYPIHTAAAAGDVAGMRAAWAADERAPVHTNNRGQNMFHIMARFGHYKALKAVFSLRGNDDRVAAREAFDRGIRALDNNKQSVLHLAVSNDEVMDFLLTRTFGRRGGAAINGVDYRLRTPLHRAALLGSLTVVTMLLEAGADADMIDKDGRHVLHLASEKGHTEVVAALMTHQTDALEAKRLEALREEAERKKMAGGLGARRRLADDDDDDDDDDEPQGPEEPGAAFERWLNLKDEHMWTPLHLASRNGHNAVIGALITGGAKADGTSSGPVGDGRRRLGSDGLAAPSMPSLPKLKSPSSPALGSTPTSPLPGSRRGSFVTPTSRRGSMASSPRTPTSAGGLSTGGNNTSGPNTPKLPPATPPGLKSNRGSISGTPGASPGQQQASVKSPPKIEEPRFQPLEEAIGCGQAPSTIHLLRSLGAGTSALAAAAVCHKPCGEQAERDDGICAKCLFRLQWQSGFRSSDEDGAGTVVTLEGPTHLRRWRVI